MSDDISRHQVDPNLCPEITQKERLDDWLKDFCTFILNSVGTSYHYTRTGNTQGWLYQGQISSNDVGIPFGFNNGELKEVWVGSSNNFGGGKSVEIYHHLGGGSSLTLLVSIPLPASQRTAVFDTDDFGVVAIPKDVQLAVQIVGGNVKEPTVFLRPTGARDV